MLPRAGLSWTDVGPGLGLVSRSEHAPKVRRISTDTWLIQNPENPESSFAAEALDERTWVLLRDRRGRQRREAVQPLAGDAWLVQSPQNQKNPVTVEALDSRTWVLRRRRGRRRSVHQIGRANLRTHLLVDAKADSGETRARQMAMGRYLADEHISWILRELRINCVLDVGANVGQYGQHLREAGYEGRIVSFEPVPHTAERLRQTAGDDSEWHVLEFGLGDATVKAEMTVVAGLGTTSSLLEASEFGKQWSSKLEGVGREQVQIRRLDEVFDDAIAGLHSPRVYLKLDTQGYDLQAFAGAGERIEQVLGMQSEVASVPIYEGMARLPEQISVYEAAGFETTGMFPVTRDRETLRVIEFDVVMIRPDARSVSA